MTPISGMAVTVTLVFADEAHREAWLEQEGIIASDMPPTNAQDEYIVSSDPVERKLQARRIDYVRRRENTDLEYLVGPIRASHKPSTR